MALMLLAGAGTASAAPLDTSVADRCRVAAFGSDTDPRGSNLRAAPSLRAPVLGRLPPIRRETEDRIIAADFNVVGGRGGWLLIENVTHPTYLEGKEDVGYPKLRGWIAAGLVTVQIGSPALRSAPRGAAPTVLDLSGDDPSGAWGPDSVEVTRMYRCSGSFVDVAIRTPDGRTARGWASGICNNQVSTCGGGGGVWEDRDGLLVEPDR